MYTVLRFAFSESRDFEKQIVSSLVDLIKKERKEICEINTDRYAEMLNIELSKSKNWNEHCADIIRGLNNLEKSIAFAATNGARIQLDIAIYTSDISSGYISLTLEMPFSLLDLLYKKNASLIYTLYDDIERAVSGD